MACIDSLTRLSPRVQRLTAPNPSPLTGAGTNTYILGDKHLSVIDPGPAIDEHIAAIAEVCAGKLETIYVTHTHQDHSPAAAPLAKLTGAKIVGMKLLPDDGKQDASFQPQHHPTHLECFVTPEYTLQAILTPGHVGNHICYYLCDEKLVFSGDHMMNGSTVVIIPPSGDMADYLMSLDRLKALEPLNIAPGHGELITDAIEDINALIEHRLKRESKIHSALKSFGKTTLNELLPVAYDDVSPSLHPWAAYSLHAHLLKLQKDNLIACSGSGDFKGQYWFEVEGINE